ncbi:hypothetical protein A2U01_0098511, partial [Trifolium medium]|nr:hypothetical protein [Trifolium medium]
AVLLGFVAGDSPAATVPFGAVVGCSHLGDEQSIPCYGILFCR